MPCAFIPPRQGSQMTAAGASSPTSVQALSVDVPSPPVYHCPGASHHGMSGPVSPKPDPLKALRRRAETALASAPSVVPASPADVDSLSHELRVHRIELEIQNENLRDLTAELQAARDHYAVLFEQAPVGYLALDRDWWIRNVNRAAAVLLGRDARKLLGRPLGGLIAPESQDAFFQLRQTAVASEEPVEREIRIRQDGRPGPWVLLNVSSGAAAPEYRVTLTDISQRIRAQEELAEHRRQLEGLVEARTSALSQALREKEVLLRELQHRVKNNLQFVSSLLSLEAGSLRPSRGRTAVRSCQLRVEAMALVHELLHLSGAAGSVSSHAFVQELAVNLASAYEVRPDRVALDIDVEDVLLGIDTAIPAGLILNELITNAFVHAFPGDMRGTLRIELSRSGGGAYRLVVADDGRGMPEGLDTVSPPTVGLTLVSRLAEQLAGSCACSSGRGTRFTVRFHDAAPRSVEGRGGAG
jgi:PAS domain S-box-containing protein